MHGLARVYQDTEQLDKGIAVASRIVAFDPDDVLAHTSLSILYQRKGMVPEAEAEANRARVLAGSNSSSKASSRRRESRKTSKPEALVRAMYRQLVRAWDGSIGGRQKLRLK